MRSICTTRRAASGGTRRSRRLVARSRRVGIGHRSTNWGKGVNDMDRQDEHSQEVIDRLAALEAQVQKLDRLVYKLFKRLPQPNQYRET